MATIEFQSKLVDTPQTLDVNNGVTTFIGGNGSGKSSILEAIFKKYLDHDDYRVICFSSGQNELFNEHKKTNRRYLRERGEPIKSFYFNTQWTRLLIFGASTFKKDGLVRKYLTDNNYIETNSLKEDVSSRLEFRFRIKKYYASLIKKEIEQEELGTNDSENEGYEFQENLLRNTEFHQTLEKIIDSFQINFDFQNNNNLIKRWLTFDSRKAFQVFTHKDINKLFSFWALATNGWLSNSELFEFKLKFKNGIEFKQLSDGEYQILSTYALIDLFDSPETIFLFDEIDSHLYFQNLKKMWNQLNNCQSTVITTTHISDSILQNNIENIKLIEDGKIKDDLTFTELSKRLSEIVGHKKYQFDILSRIKFPVLIDHINDWTIFKKLATKKLGEQVLTILDQCLPISKHSGYNNVNQVIGDKKLFFIEEFRKHTLNKDIVTEKIFLICDKDEFPNNQIQDDLFININPKFNSIKKFNNNNTHTYLLCWKRREIENYLLSPTLLQNKNCIDQVHDLYSLPTLNVGENLDNITDIREGDFKTVLRPLYNIDGIGFSEELVDQIIALIPVSEISDDIELMYNYLRDNI
jgi:ABC-type multidrug transport system ATPase subunit